MEIRVGGTYLQPEDDDSRFLHPVQVHLEPQLHSPLAQLVQLSPHLETENQQRYKEMMKIVYVLATRRRILSLVGTSGASAARARAVLAIATLLARVTAAEHQVGN